MCSAVCGTSRCADAAAGRAVRGCHKEVHNKFTQTRPQGVVAGRSRRGAQFAVHSAMNSTQHTARRTLHSTQYSAQHSTWDAQCEHGTPPMKCAQRPPVRHCLCEQRAASRRALGRWGIPAVGVFRWRWRWRWRIYRGKVCVGYSVHSPRCGL